MKLPHREGRTLAPSFLRLYHSKVFLTWHKALESSPPARMPKKSKPKEYRFTWMFEQQPKWVPSEATQAGTFQALTTGARDCWPNTRSNLLDLSR